MPLPPTCVTAFLFPQKPATLDDAISQMVALRLEAEREAMAAAYKAREDVLLTKIATLEATGVPKKPLSAVKK